MAEQANISSIEAIDRFRASLVVYHDKAAPALHEVGEEVNRLRLWLQGEGRMHWQNELRRRRVRLEAAEQQYFGARLSVMKDNISAENAAVNRARREVREAEEKLKIVAKWTQQLETAVAPLMKPLGKLESVLERRLPLAVAHLSRLMETLSDYSGTGPALVRPTSGDEPQPPSENPPP